MTDAPLISVCVANYNGIGVIDQCLTSVAGQAGDLPVEVIVHDDASTDDSVAHVLRHHPGVRLIASRENVGFCTANNRMASMARGRYLLLLNNDATLFPDALQTLLDAAKRVAQPAILGLPQYDAYSGELIDIGSRLDLFLNPVPNKSPDAADVGMVSGACFWIDRSLWEELGGFPEWFGSIAEDLYLCCRARLAGHLVIALGSSGFRHWVGRSLGGGKVVGGRLVTTLGRRALSERNKLYVMAVTYPPPMLQLVLPVNLVLLLLEGMVLALLNRRWRLCNDIYISSMKSLWRQRTKLRRVRSESQRQRRVGLRDFFRGSGLLPHKLRLLLKHGAPQIG
jgi:glycosyltransferase involved in cell wall biosynthesis